jgi:hypothetical protein
VSFSLIKLSEATPLSHWFCIAGTRGSIRTGLRTRRSGAPLRRRTGEHTNCIAVYHFNIIANLGRLTAQAQASGGRAAIRGGAIGRRAVRCGLAVRCRGDGEHASAAADSWKASSSILQAERRRRLIMSQQQQGEGHCAPYCALHTPTGSTAGAQEAAGSSGRKSLEDMPAVMTAEAVLATAPKARVGGLTRICCSSLDYIVTQDPFTSVPPRHYNEQGIRDPVCCILFVADTNRILSSYACAVRAPTASHAPGLWHLHLGAVQ